MNVWIFLFCNLKSICYLNAFQHFTAIMSHSISKNPWRISTCIGLFLSFFSGAFFPRLQAQAPNAWINELHYDNVSNDKGEGIEIIIENADLFDLSSFNVTLYNENGKVYKKELSLDEGKEETTVPPFTLYTLFVTGIPNGKAGIALSYSGELIQFISYGGTLTATEGVAKDVTAIDIGVKENDQTPEGFSLQLTGAGNRYNTFSWSGPSSHTFGEVNTGQLLRLIDGPQPVTDLQQVYLAPDKVQISWTKPIGVHKEDWDGVLLFASEEGPNAVELEEKDYTYFQGGGNVFGEGTPSGNSFTVARKETDGDGSVVVTELKAGVTYYFTAYTYQNISGSNNDEFSDSSNLLIVTALVPNISTLAAAPLSKKARFNWENTMGNKDWWKTLIVVASENPITAFPEQQHYSANATFGAGQAFGEDAYVVYNGQKEQVAVYGLENNTLYYFKVFVQYIDAENNFYWSSGEEISCIPKENTKLWIGSPTSHFMDGDNWEPKGPPGPHDDVILEHQSTPMDYEVILSSDDLPLQFNSLKILPNAPNTITVKVSGTSSSGAALTLLDEEAPLIIGDHGILINSATGSETLAIPNGPIIMEDKGTYIHNTASSHKAIIENIQLTEDYIPGTVVFDIPANRNHILSLSGKAFQNLVFSSPSGYSPSYSASGGNPLTIAASLVIDNTSLNLVSLNAALAIKGDLVLNGKLTDNTIVFNGMGEQSISGNTEEPIHLSKIRIDKPTGDLILQHDLQIKTSLLLEQGDLITNDNHVILDYSVDAVEVSIPSPNARLIGNLEVIRHVGKEKADFVATGLVMEAGGDLLGLVKVIRRTGPGAAIENGANKSIDRNWEIYVNAPLSESRLLTFSWEEGEDEEMDLTQVKVWQKDKALEEWVPIGDFQDGTQRTITVAIDEFTQFTIADEHNVLPLIFLSFTAELHADNALLKWTTSSERNNAGFQIEKSLDSSNFYVIGFEEGKGNNWGNHAYQFLDTLFYENAYFRLKQIDNDGKVSFSPIQYLAFPSLAPTALKVFPNPLVDNINFSISPQDPITFCLLYFEGGEVMYKSQAISAGRLQGELNALIPDLPSGLYILHIGIKTGVQKIKLLKGSK